MFFIATNSKRKKVTNKPKNTKTFLYLKNVPKKVTTDRFTSLISIIIISLPMEPAVMFLMQ